MPTSNDTDGSVSRKNTLSKMKKFFGAGSTTTDTAKKLNNSNAQGSGSPKLGSPLQKGSFYIGGIESELRAVSPTHSNSSVLSLSKKIDNNLTPKSLSSSSTASLGSNTSSKAPKKTQQRKKASPPPPATINPVQSPTSVTTSPNGSLVDISVPNAKASPQCKRFIVFENGRHEHHLKNAKRQEKLTSMLKNMVGAQKLRNEARSAVPDIIQGGKAASRTANYPPTLISGLVKQLEQNSDRNARGDHPISGASNVGEEKPLKRSKVPGAAPAPVEQKDSRSFAEKYGRCQEVLGKGAFGVVRICHKKPMSKMEGEKLFAVKEFKRKSSEPVDKYSKRLTSEFCISSSLHHPNIVATLDLFQDAKGDYCEVMEYCAGGDLFTLIIAFGKLEYMEADCFFKQLVRGVVYMHDMGVCHRDLKPENLLLTSNGIVKITDFGNSECFKMAWEKDIHLSGGVCGSTPYIAPEEYTHKEFDPRPVDIWACGVIYMAMRTGRQLWNAAKKDDHFYMKYLRGRREKDGYEPIEHLKRARCRNVIYSMLDPVPHRRITGKQILNSEWGREMKCCTDSHLRKPTS
ncbi:serine/threonine protein kinase SAT4 KNAG_0E01390 [Huiozyma naganishii CBS 8797]|uniref:non-specific serine/threonine protein kinase n=1 Tax=Huiozyma naganishii (strain ATCC MYA-139 / BCRC 22969 / CBS 8797 / KCTC 17520 / NBRC 10181 / NCYC 3082 / Yp74L-3) TaxID=1071383 RepID=J7S6I6_HUIN7|nr:hypothetical protein KNAG_0E01390 [Kazachstania naganishii CBS 8797]CCK70404.1 hypothetical protein KNAG_0E01390 [Kazachstania naganishii CBS 8797]